MLDHGRATRATALLLAEAQTALEAEAGDDSGAENGRIALIARRFVATELADRPARGIAGGDRFALEAFDPIVRGGPVDLEACSEPVAADD